MKKNRFTVCQVLALFPQPKHSSVTEVAEKHKIGKQTTYGQSQGSLASFRPSEVKHSHPLETASAERTQIVCRP